VIFSIFSTSSKKTFVVPHTLLYPIHSDGNEEVWPFTGLPVVEIQKYQIPTWRQDFILNIDQSNIGKNQDVRLAIKELWGWWHGWGLHNMYAQGQSWDIMRYVRNLYFKWNIWIGELQDVWRVVFAEEQGQGLGASECGCGLTVVWLWQEAHGCDEWLGTELGLVSRCHRDVMGHN